MNTESALVLQIGFSAAFFLTLLAGFYLYKNDAVLFGTHPDHPSENESGRVYNKMQVWAVWVHIAVITGLFALFLH